MSRGRWCDPGTIYRQESSYRALLTFSCNHPGAVCDTYVFHWICVDMRRTIREQGEIALTPWCQTARACRSSSSEAVSRTSSRCHRKANSWDAGFINRLNNSRATLVKLGENVLDFPTHPFVVCLRRSRAACKSFEPEVQKYTIPRKWAPPGLGA